MRLVESLSHRQREATPPAFAQFLVDEVRRRTGSHTVAVLWTMRGSVYETMSGVECWGVERDATRYDGPWPIVAHPPCGPWGRYKAVSRQSRTDGLIALLLAFRWGGVIEQPASSGLFRGGQLVAQCDYGHPAEKLTRLLWVRAIAAFP